MSDETNTIDFNGTPLIVIETVHGPSWYLVYGGWEGSFYFETGKTREPGNLRNGAYLYPDYFTAIVGVWRDHLLVSGKTAHLVEACRPGSAWTLMFGELEGPIMTYSPPSHNSLGVHSLQRDPYEARAVEVRSSLIPGAGDGLFARLNFKRGKG